MMPSLVLFDIDGTLLRPCGLGRRSLDRAFLELYGRPGVFDGMRFHGRTDPEILGDGLAAVGAPATDFVHAIGRYLEHLEVEVTQSAPLALPGVEELVVALDAREDVILGLVTGNVRRGAEIKLGRDDLFRHFPVGAVGDDHADRSELIRLACRRAAEAGYGAFAPERTLYVGDTERDVEAARVGGVVAVAVATGNMALDILAETSPDHLLPSLEPASRFLKEILPCPR